MAPSAVTSGLCPEGCCMDVSPLQYRPDSELALTAHEARVGEAAGQWGLLWLHPLCSNCLRQHCLKGLEICSAAFWGAQIQWLMNRVPTGETYYPGVIINNATFHFGPYIIGPPTDGPGPAMSKGSENERDHLPDTGCDLGLGPSMKKTGKSGFFQLWVSSSAPVAKSREKPIPPIALSDPMSCPWRVCAVLRPDVPTEGSGTHINAYRTLTCLDSAEGGALLTELLRDQKPSSF